MAFSPSLVHKITVHLTIDGILDAMIQQITFELGMHHILKKAKMSQEQCGERGIEVGVGEV